MCGIFGRILSTKDVGPFDIFFACHQAMLPINICYVDTRNTLARVSILQHVHQVLAYINIGFLKIPGRDLFFKPELISLTDLPWPVFHTNKLWLSDNHVNIYYGLQSKHLLYLVSWNIICHDLNFQISRCNFVLVLCCMIRSSPIMAIIYNINEDYQCSVHPDSITRSNCCVNLYWWI